MSKIDIDNIRPYLQDYVNRITEPSKGRNMYICPLCGSGTGRSRTGAFGIYDNGIKWKCQACGKGGDVIDLIGEYEHITEFADRVKRLGEVLGMNIEASAEHSNVQPKQETAVSFLQYFRERSKHLTETNYFMKRGISLETAQRFMLGYDPAWTHPKAPNAPTSPRLIIPVSEYSYIARDTRAEIPEEAQPYKKSKAKGRESVIWTFNHKSIGVNNRPLFIVEGEIDALSIIEAGGQAVGIGSIANVKGFLSLLEQRQPLTQPFVIALDNEDTEQVQRAREELITGIKKLGGICIERNICGSHKDPNEALTADRGTFEKAIQHAEDEAVKAVETEENADYEEYIRTSAEFDLYKFLNGIDPNADTPAIPTGFNTLDEVLEGGLYEGLIVIGGISSLGKTTLTMQIADQIAQQGRDVMIFSLEMSRNELIAKSISRETIIEVERTGKSMKLAKTNRGITAGHRYRNYSQEEKDLIETAAQHYSDYAQNIYIREGFGDMGHKQIREAVKKHVAIMGKAPVVVVDYLQIMARPDQHATDKQSVDLNTMELKRISRDFKTPVIAVSSVNRANYLTPIDFESFKESGAVEYSADLVIGLQLKCLEEDLFNGNAQGKIKEKRERIKKCKSANPRQIQLVILKNRNGKTGDTIDFKYYPEFNLYEEGELQPWEKKMY